MQNPRALHVINAPSPAANAPLAIAEEIGCIHREYRREGGLREHLVPDFLVAAHAQVQSDRLAAIDRGYLRRYFSALPLLTPF